MKYEKAINKLTNFKELGRDKQMKLLKKLLTDEELLAWQFDPSSQKGTSIEMIHRMYRAMCMPPVIRVYDPMLDKYGKETFSRTSIVVLHTVFTYAVDIQQNMVEEYKAALKDNGQNAETRDMKTRIDKYSEYIDSLKGVIYGMIKPYLKSISNDTGLQKDIVFNILMVAPEVKYIPQQRITSTTIQVLEEIYDEVNIVGFPTNGYGVKWDRLFYTIFGSENIPSVAVSILLEGAHHIDKYRNSENIIAVRDAWNSLTQYALDVLETCPDKVRSQMLELYLKKAENLISRRNGRPTDLRVNLARLPLQFKNLIRTVGLYKDQFDDINTKVRYATGKANREAVEEKDDDIVDKILDSASKIADIFTDND